MYFDNQGHIIVSPREIHELAMSDPKTLINSILLQGTPMAIQSHKKHYELLHYFAAKFNLHPNCLFFKGSTKIGFSIAPDSRKLWMEYGPESDLDLAIVDPILFERVDDQIGHWEREPKNRGELFKNHRLLKSHRNRIYQKGKYGCFRFFDLPDIDCMKELSECLNKAPILECCEVDRPISAFIFKNWWGVYERYDYDLHCLCKGFAKITDPLPVGEDKPRPHVELVDGNYDEIILEIELDERSARINELEMRGAVWDSEGQYYSCDGGVYDADGELL